jgi:hypothetical protein
MSKHILAVAALGSLGLSVAAHAQTAVTENTTVGGRAFIDLTSVDQTSYNTTTGAASNSAANGFGVDLGRFYLILDHTFDSMWSANLTTDVTYASSTGTTNVYVKKAYVQAKIADAFTVRAGSADLPWIPYSEGVYGYRYVEKVIADRLGYGTSADWGVHALGKFGDGGIINYAVAAVEGNGYKNPTRSKALDWEGRLSLAPFHGFTAAAGFYTGKLGKDVEQATTPVTPVAPNTASRLDLMASYTIQSFKVGVEYFNTDHWKSVSPTTALAKDKVDGLSVFANFQIDPKSAVFARYDSATVDSYNNLAVKTELKDEYFNVGYAYKPRKGIDLAVVYKHDDQKTGGVKSLKRDEFGVWAQVGF